MEILNETDQTLILACRRGDVQAWEKLLHKYERLVFSIPLNYGLSRDDAADIGIHCLMEQSDYTAIT